MVNTRPRQVVRATVEALLTAPSDLATVAACAKALLCCGEAAAARGLLQSAINQGVSQTALDFELLMRLERLLGTRIEDPRRADHEGHSDWANAYAQAEEDIIYPADLVDMLVSREDGGHRFVFLDRCRSCGAVARFAPLVDALEHGRFLCPFCLARKDVTEEQLFQAASRGYLELLRKLENRLAGEAPTGPALDNFLDMTMALEPLVLVRYGCLRADRIGHLAIQPEVYLAEQDVGLRSTRILDIFGWSEKVCNHKLLDMWRRALRASPLGRALAERLANLPSGREHVIPGAYGLGRRGLDRHRSLGKTAPHLAFTPEEEAAAAAERRRMGLSEDTPYICFFARDSAYLARTIPEVDCSYHDFRDSDINAYLPAAKALTGQGYHALRMGSVVARSLASPVPRVIDYATHHRSELMDIHLLAHCRFFLSGGSGIDAVASIFRRPIVYVNWIPLLPAIDIQGNAVVVFKLLWSRAEKRFLRFPEMFTPELLTGYETGLYERLGLDVVDNSPEEIQDAALEMEARLDGSWVAQAGDDERQERFWSLFWPICPGRVPAARVGAAFLRQHARLLEAPVPARG